MSATGDPVQRVLRLLSGVKPAGAGQWQARCPAHEDRVASLSVGRGDDGRALVHCHAGCEPTAVLSAVGLTSAGLFADAGNGNDRRPRRKAPATHATPAAPAGRPAAGGKIVKTYDYRNAVGELLYQVVRFEPKDFRQRRPDGNGGWLWSLGDVPRVLYRLPELLAADPAFPVFIVEGEKDADNVAGVGLVTTTCPGGAGNWSKLANDSALHGRAVVIIPDRDKPGQAHAQDVAARLYGKAAAVRIIDLPGDAKDVSEWMDGLDAQEPADLAAALLKLATNAPAWTPPPAATLATTAQAVEPYRPFPVECLPEPMRSFVAQAAKAVGCDAAFVALPLLAALASAIGNTRCIELKRGWTEPAILWAAIVGDSGTLKSPALELALRPLRRRQQEAVKRHAQETESHTADVLQYEIDLAAWKKSGGEGPPPVGPQTPILPRCWCDDTTIEALAVLLQQNWRGLLMVRDELAGWLGGFDRYAQGKGSDVAKWLEMHGGRSIMVDRKTGNPRTIYVPHAAVSVTGGIQPATLQRALGREYFDNGLAARLLLACPPRRVRQWTEAEIDPVTEAAVAAVFERLYSLEPAAGPDGEPEQGIVRLSPAAKAAWIRFYDDHAQEQVDMTGDLSAAWSKLEGYAARLTLVAHMARWAAGDATLVGPDVVDESSVAAGVALSHWFGQETRRVYAMLNETDDDRQRRALVDLVRRQGGSITTRGLQQASRRYRASAEEAEAALAELVKAGLGRWVHDNHGGGRGRPVDTFELANDTDNGNTIRQGP